MTTSTKWILFAALLAIVAALWYFLDHRNLQLVPVDAGLASETATTTSATASSTPSAATSQSSASTSMKNSAHRITIKTTKGTIVFETYDADAPNTVKNFLTLADKGFYNGTIFHRVIEGFMIQGGDPTGTGRGGPGYQFADELNPSTPSYKAGYARGTVAMANAGPNTNGSQFFIMQKDTPLPHNYTIFGKVVSGMDVVDAIAASQVDQNDKPVQAVTMQSVTEQAI